uniref:Nucleotide-diphospho-sugar transferase domain-containing protein n=1 Tax=viral metagenome TaxID=1070528 RepID=A0A6C0F662_9ZZZZ|tara:strand:+ start:12821 stop:13468 length:648 start_codon:yes stop_codon:yes gene_type:complete
MIIVIQSWRLPGSTYHTHLNKLINSMDYTKQCKIVIVFSGEKEKQIWNDDKYTYITMNQNMWEYTSYLAIYSYLNTEFTNDNIFLMLHDTCYVDNSTTFWKNLTQMVNIMMTNKDIDFIYPSEHTKKNIGLISYNGIEKFYHFLINHQTMTKADTIKYEHFIPNNMNYKCMPGYKHIGKKIINDKVRRLHFFPYLSLYKHNSFRGRDNHKGGSYR